MVWWIRAGKRAKSLKRSVRLPPLLRPANANRKSVSWSSTVKNRGCECLCFAVKRNYDAEIERQFKLQLLKQMADAARQEDTDQHQQHPPRALLPPSDDALPELEFAGGAGDMPPPLESSAGSAGGGDYRTSAAASLRAAAAVPAFAPQVEVEFGNGFGGGAGAGSAGAGSFGGGSGFGSSYSDSGAGGAADGDGDAEMRPADDGSAAQATVASDVCCLVDNALHCVSLAHRVVCCAARRFT